MTHNSSLLHRKANKLAADHAHIVGGIVGGLYRTHLGPALRQSIGDKLDAMQLGHLTLILAARSYLAGNNRPRRYGKGCFEYYARSAIRRAVLRAAGRLRTVNLVELPEDLAAPESPRTDEIAALAEALAQLDGLERHVVGLLFGLEEHAPHTQAAAGQALHLSPHQIRTIWQGAQAKLRATLKGEAV